MSITYDRGLCLILSSTVQGYYHIKKLLLSSDGRCQNNN